MNRTETLEKAYRLWKRYKTSTAEYRRLAESLGMQTTDLNQECWHINHARTWNPSTKEMRR